MTDKVFIYFFVANDIVKIGRSTNWRRRKDEVNNRLLSTAYPYVSPRLILVDSPYLEGILHDRFQQSRIRGDSLLGREWFRLTPDIEAYIKRRMPENVTQYWNGNIAINGWDEGRFERWRAEQVEKRRLEAERKKVEAYKDSKPKVANMTNAEILEIIAKGKAAEEAMVKSIKAARAAEENEKNRRKADERAKKIDDYRNSHLEAVRMSDNDILWAIDEPGRTRRERELARSRAHDECRARHNANGRREGEFYIGYDAAEKIIAAGKAAEEAEFKRQNERRVAAKAAQEERVKSLHTERVAAMVATKAA